MKFALIILYIILIPLSNGFSAIFIYKDEQGRMTLTNTLEPTVANKYNEQYDKFQLIYAKSEEIDELKKKDEQLRLLSDAERNEFKFDNEITKIAARYNLEFNLIKAVIKAMSKYDVNFKDSERTGLMGIKKNWILSKPAKSNAQNDTTPITNIEIGAVKLQEYLLRYDYDMLLTLAAYYLSPETVDDELAKNGDLPRIPECRAFINNTLQSLKVYNESAETRIKRKIVQRDGAIMIYNSQDEQTGGNN